MVDSCIHIFRGCLSCNTFRNLTIESKGFSLNPYQAASYWCRDQLKTPIAYNYVAYFN